MSDLQPGKLNFPSTTNRRNRAVKINLTISFEYIFREFLVCRSFVKSYRYPGKKERKYLILPDISNKNKVSFQLHLFIYSICIQQTVVQMCVWEGRKTCQSRKIGISVLGSIYLKTKLNLNKKNERNTPALTWQIREIAP